jgi:hypothetical protein
LTHLINMAFSPEEQQIINWSIQSGKSSQETKDAILRFRMTGSPKEEKPLEEVEETASYFTRVGERIAEEAVGAKEAVFRGAEIIQEAQDPQKSVGQKLAAVLSGYGRSFLGATGAATRVLFSPLTQALSPILSPVIKDAIEESPQAQAALEKFGSWANEHPDAANALIDSIDTITAIGGVKLGKEALRGAAPLVQKAGEAVGATAVAGVKGVKGVVAPIVEKTARIPARFKTNIETVRAFEQEVKTLPTQIAKNAARDGIDVPDIKFIYSLPKENADEYLGLTKAAKEFAQNPKATNPIELVGKPISERVKFLETERARIGKELGDVANNLGIINKPELTQTVLGRLNRVRGLEGLTERNGILNFKNTSLASTLSKSDRKAIQDAFTQATRWGDGKRVHLFRQELFEILGGKKKSLAGITDTQDRAYQAIRQGLSDVLETKNEAYKTLSNEYRQVIQPLSDLRRVMKTIPDATEDILDMQAGLLARRLTSAAPSNPKIRDILRRLDEAGAVKGTTRTSVEALQDLYNILNKYYDIAPKTGFQGLTREAIESTGLQEAAMRSIRGLVGETPQVRQKALENILQEVFSI